MSYNESRVVSPSEVKGLFPSLDVRLWRRLEGIFPVRITRSWMNRVRAVDGPLGRQVFPRDIELEVAPDDVIDPVGEEGKMPHPLVVQKHDDRLLILVTRRCHLHCRYCFRRDLDGESDPSLDAIDDAIAFAKNAKVREVILSGGDPLVLRTNRLNHILSNLRPEVPETRIHTRAPITFPARVDTDLVTMLRRHAPMRMVVHCNHPDELSPDVDAALERLIEAGIPLLNQSVLLKGVNDDASVLAALNRALIRRGVKPYYIHHPDAVPGGAAFRVSIERGLALYDALQSELGNESLPTYVIDPPDGTGKVPVADWVQNSVTSGS